MVVVVVMVVRAQQPAKGARHHMVMMMVVMVVMVVLRHLHFVGRGGRRCLLRQASIICSQGGDRVWNRIEKIPIASGRREFSTGRRRRSLGGSHCRKGSSRSEQTGYLLVHKSSKGVVRFVDSPGNNALVPTGFRSPPIEALQKASSSVRAAQYRNYAAAFAGASPSLMARRRLAAQAAALGRAETSACQRRTLARFSGRASFETRMKSTATIAVMSATV